MCPLLWRRVAPTQPCGRVGCAGVPGTCVWRAAAAELSAFAVNLAPKAPGPRPSRAGGAAAVTVTRRSWPQRRALLVRSTRCPSRPALRAQPPSCVPAGVGEELIACGLCQRIVDALKGCTAASGGGGGGGGGGAVARLVCSTPVLGCPPRALRAAFVSVAAARGGAGAAGDNGDAAGPGRAWVSVAATVGDGRRVRVCATLSAVPFAFAVAVGTIGGGGDGGGMHNRMGGDAAGGGEGGCGMRVASCGGLAEAPSWEELEVGGARVLATVCLGAPAPA